MDCGGREVFGPSTIGKRVQRKSGQRSEGAIPLPCGYDLTQILAEILSASETLCPGPGIGSDLYHTTILLEYPSPCTSYAASAADTILQTMGLL